MKNTNYLILSIVIIALLSGYAVFKYLDVTKNTANTNACIWCVNDVYCVTARKLLGTFLIRPFPSENTPHQIFFPRFDNWATGSLYISAIAVCMETFICSLLASKKPATLRYNSAEIMHIPNHNGWVTMSFNLS